MTVRQAKDKSWYARVSYKENGKYKKKSKYNFKTKKEANIWKADIQAQLNNGINISDNPSFADYFTRWFEVFKRPKIAAPTIANYKATHDKLVIFFRDTPMKSITRTDYQMFINEYAQTLAKGTMKKTNEHIRACVRDAVHNGDLPKDFTYDVDLSGKDGIDESTKYISQSETKRLLSALHDGLEHSAITRYMAILALFSGLRYAELAGLTYSDVDYKNNIIKVNKSWIHRESRFSTTKTKNTRTVKIEPSIMNLLRIFITEQKKLLLAHPHIINPNKLVFAQHDGKPPSNAAANKSLRRACKRANVQGITFHSLRHTHASILLFKGMDISSIAKRLGHKSTTTTADTYAHIIEEMQTKSDNLSDEAMRDLL